MAARGAILDAGAVLDTSRAFYREHGLAAWADALPDAAQLPPDLGGRLRLAAERGFTEGVAFPAPSVQAASLPGLIEAMAARTAPGVPQEEQYAEPYASALDGMQPRNRPDGPYILLYSAGPFPPETRNKSIPQLDRLFAERGWDALTVPEYLVLQRLALLRNGDHSFDLYTGDSERSQWMWLLDTRLPGGCVQGYWNPGKRRVELGACKAGSKNERRGAHPTLVVPMLP